MRSTPDEGIPFVVVKYYENTKLIGYSVIAVVIKGSEGNYVYTFKNAKTEIGEKVTELNVDSKINEAKSLFR